MLNPEKIILFGSCVNGTPWEHSDIDIAVVMNDYQGNWLDTAVMLCGLKRQVSIDIEPHLLDESCDRSGFLEFVKKSGEVIYEAPSLPAGIRAAIGRLRNPITDGTSCRTVCPNEKRTIGKTANK